MVEGWYIPDNLDTSNFDFSWRPAPEDNYRIHQFGTQHQGSGGPAYIVPEHDGIKFYRHQRAIRLPDPYDPKWVIHQPLPLNFSFDYSWHPCSYATPARYIFQPHHQLNTYFYNELVITYDDFDEALPPRTYSFCDYRAGIYRSNNTWHTIPYYIADFSAKHPEVYDIVFISNGEPNAEDNWQHLCNITGNIPNRLHRIDGVSGRVQAYQAAAQASTTPYFFTVFGKLEVEPTFDFSYIPDRLHFDRHIIFHATNPVNGLVYGHQAMILYNKSLVVNNKGQGLDFTMDDSHEVVPINSGIARYNCDDWTEWRTTFREIIKLCCQTDSESIQRLHIWSHESNSPTTTKAVHQAIEYYNEHKDEPDKLKLTYEWSWLRTKYIDSI